MPPTVTIIEHGRDGQVLYSEGLLHTLTGYWEFGGGEVITSISMGSRDEWRQHQPWALERRTSILRFVAEEVIRQRAPSCSPTIDEEQGVILLKKTGEGTSGTSGAKDEGSSSAQAAAFVRRYKKYKVMLMFGVLAVALIAGAIWWMGKKVLSVAPANGVPLNEAVRYGGPDPSDPSGIASLVQYTDPHLPEITGRGGNTTTSISVLLIPSSGGEPKVVPLVKEVAGQGYALARIIGSDGLTLWCDAVGLFGVCLHDHSLVTAKDLQEANPSLDTHWWNDTRSMDIIDGRLHITNDDRSAGLDVDAATLKATAVASKVSRTRFNKPAQTDYLAAGFLTRTGAWFGLHSAAELEGEFKPGQWVRAVESGEEAKEQRRLCTGTTEPSSDGEYHRIQSISPLGESTYLNAALLRLSATEAPLQLADPTSVLMLYTSAPGLQGTLVIARVDLNGKVIWTADTGLDRFLLQRILPDANAFAFVGTRPPVEGKLSEPLVVIVDNSTGKITSHSLWR
ncbi:MAG: hypothetical protein JNJ91_11475 [Flavobacteriales bacterium]|nr:hypothetical protein [Flavobacteriales bacterium]